MGSRDGQRCSNSVMDGIALAFCSVQQAFLKTKPLSVGVVLRDMNPLLGKEATGAGTSFLSEVSETDIQLLGATGFSKITPRSQVW